MKSVKDVVDRVRSLLNVDVKRGSSPAEAATAAAEAQRLILQYQLDAESLLPSAESMKIVDEDIVVLSDREYFQDWEVVLATAVVQANGCTMIKTGYVHPYLRYIPMAVTQLRVIGTRPRVDMAKALYPLLCEQLQRVGQGHYEEHGRGGLDDYMTGAAVTVGEKLVQERADSRRRASSDAGDKALELVDDDLKRAHDYADMITDVPPGIYPDVNVRDKDAYKNGCKAGDCVSTDVGQRREMEAPRQLTAGG